MSKKNVILSLGLTACVAFLTVGWDWNFDNLGTKEAATTAEEPEGKRVDGVTCGESLPYEGQNYATIQIGTQCWMAENLNVGTQIDGKSDMEDTANVEKYCYQDDEANCATYGGLYQWNQAMRYDWDEGVEGICPYGWHLPSDAEWHQLEGFFAKGSCDGNRLGEDCDPAGTDLQAGGKSGFEGIFTGYQNFDGVYGGLEGEVNFWTSSTLEYGSVAYTLRIGNTKVIRNSENLASGFAIRCVKN